MAYKRKEKKSLLLYYDYIEQFKMLNDKQLRNLIYAMIEYDKNKLTKLKFGSNILLLSEEELRNVYSLMMVIRLKVKVKVIIN